MQSFVWQSQECKTDRLNSFVLPLRGSFISLFRSPRTAPSLRSGLSWAIIEPSLRDDGATQLDEAERTNLFCQQITSTRLSCSLVLMITIQPAPGAITFSIRQGLDNGNPAGVPSSQILQRAGAATKQALAPKPFQIWTGGKHESNAESGSGCIGAGSFVRRGVR